MGRVIAGSSANDCPFAKLFAEAIDSPLVDQVLEPGVTPIAPIAMVPEDRRDFTNRGRAVLLGDEAERLGESGNGIALVVGHPEATTYQHVEAANTVLIQHREQPDILGIDVDAVVG